MVTEESALRLRYEKAGQSHVFDYMDDLSDSERQTFLEQLAGIPVEKIPSLLQSAMAEQAVPVEEIAPFTESIGRSTDISLMKASYKTGMQAIAQGKVAALVLAGGQGTRLGYDGPKGLYDIGLPSKSSLFGLLASRILKLRTVASLDGGEEALASLPFYVMTSPLNHEPTMSFFEENDYFGLGEDNVFVFQQGMLPCVTDKGKIILESAGVVAMAPDGNGGIYPSLQSSGALDDMKSRRIEYLHVFSIDNALCKPADPVFCGYCIQTQADCGNKVVWKSHAHEKVGVVAMRGHKPCIVEYSEITKEMAQRVDEADRLVFGAGNICNHFYTLDFIQHTVLPNMGHLYHVARKKIPCWDATTQKTVKPESNNGIKLETFIFDVFPLSEKMSVLDVQREEEFAPVKNASGDDSPATARDMISKLHQGWLVEAGATLRGDLSLPCEVSALVSYAGEGLESYRDHDLECPFHLQ